MDHPTGIRRDTGSRPKSGVRCTAGGCSGRQHALQRGPKDSRLFTVGFLP